MPYRNGTIDTIQNPQYCLVIRVHNLALSQQLRDKTPPKPWARGRHSAAVVFSALRGLPYNLPAGRGALWLDCAPHYSRGGVGCLQGLSPARRKQKYPASKKEVHSPKVLHIGDMNSN